MSVDWEHNPETWVGMDVDVVLCADDTRHKGTITTLISMWCGGELLTDSMPFIKLNDGRTVQGIECWWTKDDPSLHTGNEQAAS